MPRIHSALAATESAAYIFGGLSQRGKVLQDMHILDFCRRHTSPDEALGWASVPQAPGEHSSPGPRHQHVLIGVPEADVVVLIGGTSSRVGKSLLSDVWLYSPSTLRWRCVHPGDSTTVAQLARRKSSRPPAGMGAAGARVRAEEGSGGDRDTAADVSGTATPATVSAAPVGRVGAAVCAVGTSVLMFGGSTASSCDHTSTTPHQLLAGGRNSIDLDAFVFGAASGAGGDDPEIDRDGGLGTPPAPSSGGSSPGVRGLPRNDSLHRHTRTRSGSSGFGTGAPVARLLNDLWVFDVVTSSWECLGPPGFWAPSVGDGSHVSRPFVDVGDSDDDDHDLRRLQALRSGGGVSPSKDGGGGLGSAAAWPSPRQDASMAVNRRPWLRGVARRILCPRRRRSRQGCIGVR